jgi:hypothetical protein
MAKSSVASASTSVSPSLFHFSDKISEEVICSVCLDILVYPQTLVPCGHSFCGCCRSKDLAECPQCRQVVSCSVPARHLEALINTLVSIPNILKEDDVQHYQKRIKKETSKGFMVSIWISEYS